MKIRVLVNIAKPIKRRMRLCINEGKYVAVQFQYKRLPSMCLICGMFQHTESQCALTYVKTVPLKKMYDKSILACLRKDMITEEDRWLRDENGCSFVPT